MKTKKTVFAFLVLLAFVFTSFSAGAEGEEWRDKISPDVFSAPENEDGEISVMIFRAGSAVPSEKEIEKAFFEKYGYHTDLYENQYKYKNVTVPRLTEEFYEKNGRDNTDPEALQKWLTDSMNEYVKNRRGIIREIVTASNEEYIEKNGIDRSKIEYSGGFTGTLVINATEEQIITLAKDETVQSISCFDNGIQQPHAFSADDGESYIASDAESDIATDGKNEGNTAESVPETADPDEKDGESEASVDEEKDGGVPLTAIAAICFAAVCVAGAVVFAVKKKRKVKN